MWYSPADLEKIACPSLPKTAKGIRERAIKDKWPSNKVRSSRGGRGGTKFVYEPPPDVQKEIDAHMARAPALVENPMRDSRSDAALRLMASEAPNPDDFYKKLRLIRYATEVTERLQRELGFKCPGKWLSTLQVLLFTEQITEIAARHILEQLKGSS